jgi:hypothetical protein
MEQSDLSRLQLFVKTLPKNKAIEEWNERYIDDARTYSGYEDAKLIAIKNNRFVKMLDMSADGYSIKPYEELCDQPKKKETNDCHECCSESGETEGKCEYDPEKCNRFFAENVHNWNELCGYHILFLQGKTPGTPDHPGPWNKETQYIIDPLIRILQKGILTMDSQPGLINSGIEPDEYIQKPYLMIAGPAGRIHRILIKILFPSGPITLDNSIIKYVPYGIRPLDFNNYDYYEQDDGLDYVTVMLGIDTPNILTKEYSDYVFSNRFFDRIAEIVRTTA